MMPLKPSSTKSRIIFFSLLVLCGVFETLSPARASATMFCVQVEKNATLLRRVPVASGSVLRLRFQHSLYGSQVEEVFHLRPDGFQLTELRYAELRLVEFYGHESAKYEDATWIVRPEPALIPSLNLHSSFDASLLLFFDDQTRRIQLGVPADSALSLSIAPCQDTHND